MKTALVIPWAEDQPPSESAIRQKLTEEGLAYYPWSNGAHEMYGDHTHPYHKIIYVVHGSITFFLPEKSFTLVQGDRLELPVHTVHGALVGASGVTCFEAHLV